MANHEIKHYTNSLHLYLAFSRSKDSQKVKCMRVVARDKVDLKILELRARMAGGKWRIHKTVNKRDTEKARNWLLKKLIDFPQAKGFIDSLWRTALLQPECIYGKKKFLLDIDTKDRDKLEIVKNLTGKNLIKEIETENGWHFITQPFDTRKVCELSFVDLIRDGYVYIKTIKER